MHVHEYTETKHTETAAERLLPNIWTHGTDGSIHPPNMSNYPRLSSVTELLAKTFPYHLEDLGIEISSLVETPDRCSDDEHEVDNSESDDDDELVVLRKRKRWDSYKGKGFWYKSEKEKLKEIKKK